MNAYERVMNRLAGKPVDKIPNLNIVMMFAAKYIKVPYSQYVRDYKCLVEGNIACCEAFGIDVVTTMSDPFRETHGFGAQLIYPKDGIPYCKETVLKDFGQLKTLKAIDPLKDERMLQTLKAIELYKTQVGGQYPIIGWVEGALAEAADLRGVNEFMMDLMLETERVEELLEVIYEQQYAYMKAQIQAGADIIGVGDAVASLIGPDLYQRYGLPYEKRIIQDIHNLGGKAKLHICGNITPILKDIVKTEADIVDIDWMVDFKQAIDVFRETAISVCGNMNPVSVFLRGNAEIVEEEVKKCVALADKKTLIAAGCEIPRDTPIENLKIMEEVCKYYL